MFSLSHIEFLTDVKVDFPLLINLELKVEIDRLPAPSAVEILGLTCTHCADARTHRLAHTSLPSNSPSLSADLRGARCLICPYHSGIVDEAPGHRLNVII